MKRINTAILGASGYTGAELLRLLQHHPVFHVVALTGETQAGKPVEAVYPHLRNLGLPALVKHAEVDFSNIELVFCCLPHGTTQTIIAALPEHVKIVDLSADFRLQSGNDYAEWYGHTHQALELQKTAIYGITEFARDAVKTARLVANPGCYPTCSLLPLIPLIEKEMIAHDHIVITAMSGISGAGRSAKQEMLFTELDGGVSAYGIGRHRHVAEMEQELTKAAQQAPRSRDGRGEPERDSANEGVWGDRPHHSEAALKISFTPHLVPMSRGMLATIRVMATAGVTADSMRATLTTRYAGEPFVTVLPSGAPSTHQVRGTNQCVMSVHAGRLANEVIIVSAIDNLVKGASGQALQNANIMFNLPETTNLERIAIFP